MAETRLLIVDDEPEVAEIVRLIAVDMGFTIEVVTRPTEFKKTYNAFAPTVIVLDVVMPEIDGIELMNWMAEQDSTAQIIVASGYNPEYARMAQTIGKAEGVQVSYLDKPFQLDALRAALRKAAAAG